MTTKSNNSKIRSSVLNRRYLWKNGQGKVIETEEQMYQRIANAIAAVESKHGATNEQIEAIACQFYQLMAKGEFLPNSPTLMNAGRENGMLSACFVLPIEDSIDGIFTTVKNTAMIQKAGGGTGFDFSPLRPTGDMVSSSGGKTSGPISFWKVIAETTNAIQQGAFRRGANMGMMNINHPDILKFINAKQNLSDFTNFNISVKVPNSFMERLHKNPNALHIVINPRTNKRYALPCTIDIGTYSIDDLIPEDLAYDESYTVKNIWDMIVENAHTTGEPGLCFIDRINETNPTPHLGPIEATNPCGEQPLLPYEACNLGSINVAKFVSEDGTDMDWERLKDTVKLAIRFLDNVIDANHYPLPRIEKISLGNRKIGLGIMGFADALILMGMSYAGCEAVDAARRISRFINENGHKASEELAKMRGSFPNWKGSTWDTKYNKPMRNAAVTTIAPTGSISLIGECSSGIEPVFSFAYKRIAIDGGEFFQIHPLLEKLGTEQGWLNKKTKAKLLEGKKLQEIPEIPEELLDILVTAYDVLPDHHVDIQAAFQSNIDNAVSKTINLPTNTSVDIIDKIFRFAHEERCKGITVYRDGCRENQVITTAHEEMSSVPEYIMPRPRTRKTKGETTKYTMGCGKLYVSVNKDEKGLCEIFANLGKAGGCPAQSEATCRVVSAALRSGVRPEILIEQLKGIRCLSTVTRRKLNKCIDVLSCPDAIARAIEESLGQNYKPIETSPTNKCPDCSFPLRMESGCNICDNCGYSKCG